jgi:hypothetical protein
VVGDVELPDTGTAQRVADGTQLGPAGLGAQVR